MTANPDGVRLLALADKIARGAEPSVAIRRSWLEHVIGTLQGDLPSGRIGDVVFLLRDQLQDILNSAAPVPQRDAEPVWTVRRPTKPADKDYPADAYWEVCLPDGTWDQCVAVDADDAKATMQELWKETHPAAAQRFDAGSARPSVNEYVAGYEYRGDQDYTPTEFEREIIEDAIEGYLATPPALPAGEEVQDTFFTDSRLPIMAMSGDVESDRVLKLHFRRRVTEADRARLTEVLNAGESALSPSSNGEP